MSGWSSTTSASLLSSLDTRMAKTNRGSGQAALDEFRAVMDTIEDPAAGFITEAERAAPAADPFTAAVLANEARVGLLLLFCKEVKPLLAGISTVPISIAAEMDPLDFFRSLDVPIINRVAHTALVPPAESVDAECLFSLAGIIVSKLCAALAPEMAEMQILLSSWLRRDKEVAKVMPELLAAMVENTQILDFLSASAEAESDSEADA